MLYALYLEVDYIYFKHEILSLLNSVQRLPLSTLLH